MQRWELPADAPPPPAPNLARFSAMQGETRPGAHPGDRSQILVRAIRGIQGLDEEYNREERKRRFAEAMAAATDPEEVLYRKRWRSEEGGFIYSTRRGSTGAVLGEAIDEFGGLLNLAAQAGPQREWSTAAARAARGRRRATGGRSGAGREGTRS